VYLFNVLAFQRINNFLYFFLIEGFSRCFKNGVHWISSWIIIFRYLVLYQKDWPMRRQKGIALICDNNLLIKIKNIELISIKILLTIEHLLAKLKTFCYQFRSRIFVWILAIISVEWDPTKDLLLISPRYPFLVIITQSLLGVYFWR
jgi:hypothetical protein